MCSQNIKGWSKICTWDMVYSQIWLYLPMDDCHFGYKQKFLALSVGLLSGLFIKTSMTRQQNQLWLRLVYEKKTESEISFHWHVGKICCSITVLCYSKYIRGIENLRAPQRRRVMCRSWAVSVQWTTRGKTLHLAHPQRALASVRHVCPGILSSVDCLLQCICTSYLEGVSIVVR